MTPVLIAVLTVAAIVLTVVSARRALAERNVVERQQQTLDLLGSLADRAAADRPTPGAGRSRSARSGAARSGPPTDRRADPGRPLDPDGRLHHGRRPAARPRPPARRGAVAERRPVPVAAESTATSARVAARTGRPDKPEKYRPRHGKAPTWPQRVKAAGLVALVVIVCLGLVGGVYLVLRGRSAPSTAAPPPSGQTTSTPATSATTAPPTTAAAPIVLISETRQEASYRVQDTSATVDLVAASSCWIQITAGVGTGTVTYAGVLRSGDSRAVTDAATASGASVRVCNPTAVSLSVNGTPMALPQLSGGQPYTLVFEPA